jgi:hypothetical protein
LHFLPLALLALNFLILSFSYIFYRVTFFKGSKIGTAKFLAGIWHTQKNIESYNSIFRQRIFFQKIRFEHLISVNISHIFFLQNIFGRTEWDCVERKIQLGTEFRDIFLNWSIL